MKPGLLLVVQWYVADDWYGKRYRVILSIDDEQDFRTKTDAKKYTSLIKKYVRNLYSFPNKKEKITVMVKSREEDDLRDYVYCGNGPSLSYTHYNISIKDLEEKLNEF